MITYRFEINRHPWKKNKVPLQVKASVKFLLQTNLQQPIVNEEFWLWWRQGKPTQLLVILAKIIAHVGNFDNRRRRGGNLPFLTEDSVLPAWINLNSDWLIRWLSRGSLVAPYPHMVSQSSPRDEKRTKGPEIPIDDITIGVTSKPVTLPRWNPAMEIPTALARSFIGNHLIIDTHTSE